MATLSIPDSMPVSPPDLSIEPRVALLDQPVRILARGLESGARVEVHARMEDATGSGVRWESRAEFEADARGMVDLAARIPCGGDYAGCDPMGMFRHMRSRSGRRASSQAPLDGAFVPSTPIRLTLTRAGATLAETTLVRRHVAEDVTIRPVPQEGIVARVFQPAGRGPRPALLVIGGDPGGFASAQAHAAMFASHGYTSVAMACFGVAGFPPSLARVPIEIVETALLWLEAQPGVDPERIGVFGRGKGAELALLAATVHPQIRLVITQAPTAFVFEGLSGRQTPSRSSSWTFRGRDVAYVPFPRNPVTFLGDLFGASLRRGTVRLDAIHAAALQDAERADAGAIAVERINGPVLMISGRDDAFWPSSDFARMIEERLESHRFAHEVRRLDYDGVGHDLPLPNAPAVPVYGGTAVRNARAAVDAWARTLTFLGRHFSV